MPRMGPGYTIVRVYSVYSLRNIASRSVMRHARYREHSVCLTSDCITSFLYALYKTIMIESYCVESE